MRVSPVEMRTEDVHWGVRRSWGVIASREQAYVLWHDMSAWSGRQGPGGPPLLCGAPDGTAAIAVPLISSGARNRCLI